MTSKGVFIRNMKTKKEAVSIGIIGIPDEETITMLGKELGKPIKKIEKNGKIILLVGKGLNSLSLFFYC